MSACVYMCFLNVALTLNDRWQTSQTQGRSSECVAMCFFSDCEMVNALSHSSHLYGRSPVCLRICTVRVFLWASSTAWYLEDSGRSSCLLRFPCSLNPLSHSVGYPHVSLVFTFYLSTTQGSTIVGVVHSDSLILLVMRWWGAAWRLPDWQLLHFS